MEADKDGELQRIKLAEELTARLAAQEKKEMFTSAMGATDAGKKGADRSKVKRSSLKPQKSPQSV